MALPVIKINSSGSDTAASGAGPATALFGTGASLNATSTVTLSADTPNLSGVATDGSAVLWVDTSSGRQFSKITGVDDGADTVTTENAYSVTESGRNWGIGGKRATLDNAGTRTLFSATGAGPGWTIEIEDDQTLAGGQISVGAVGDTTTGFITIRGASDSPRPIITQTAHANIFNLGNASNHLIEKLHFKNSNATKTSSTAVTGGNGAIVWVRNCIVGDATDRIAIGISAGGTGTWHVFDCEIKECAVDNARTANANFSMRNCWLHDAQGSGAGLNQTAAGLTNIDECLIEGNGGNGITIPTTGRINVQRSTIHGNGGDGISIASIASLARVAIINNNITGNGGYGIDLAVTEYEVAQFIDYNNYGTGATANTSGARNNLAAGAGDLAVDPGYINAAGNNFGVGSSLREKGYPSIARTIGANVSSTISYMDIGAAQRKEGGRLLVRT